jgi:uncharacterized HhH-GPD family protein
VQLAVAHPGSLERAAVEGRERPVAAALEAYEAPDRAPVGGQLLNGHRAMLAPAARAVNHVPASPRYDRAVPDRLYFTDSDEACALIAADPMALLVGFELDQQVTVRKAFAGPLALKERLGSIDPATLAAADLEPVFRERPVIHRYPRSMAQRVHDLAIHVRDRYGGDAARVWTDAEDAAQLRANLAALPGFGDMKIKVLGAVLAKHFGVEAARELVPWHPTLGDVDSPQALDNYEALKREHKAEWAKAKAPV